MPLRRIELAKQISSASGKLVAKDFPKDSNTKLVQPPISTRFGVNIVFEKLFDLYLLFIGNIEGILTSKLEVIFCKLSRGITEDTAFVL